MPTSLGAEDSYDVFDVSGTFDFGSRASLRFGIDNLFDELPVCTGGRTAADPHPAPCGGETEAGFYDVLGRSAYVGIRTTF
jgi:outer membrane receptor protein involved in Fe transport